MSKPYDFIPLLETKEYLRKNQLLKGKIELEIRALTPIHVSQDSYEMNDKSIIYKEFFKINDQYAIPGTSIKGMIRNLAEMTSNSCILVTNEMKKYMPRFKKLPCGKNEHCIICDIFGAMGRKSKIKVSDFKYEEGSGKRSILCLPDLKSPKFNDIYVKDGNLKGYKIYHHGLESIVKSGNSNFQCFLKNSAFKGFVIYENLDEKELQLLCYSLGLSESFNHKIGYGKPAYYGSIEVICKDDKYVQYAKQYEEGAGADIKDNIKLLSELYSYKNAKSKAEYDGTSY